jgi:hypothetical protein
MALNPLAPGKQAYYPSLGPEVPSTVRDAIRRAFDSIYKIAGQLLPAGISKFGRGTILIPVTPEIVNVPGCQIQLARAGLWAITGVFTINVIDAGDIASIFTGSLFVAGTTIAAPKNQLVVPGTTQPGVAKLQVQAEPQIFTIAQTWQVNVQASATAKLQLQKDVGTGLSESDGSNSSISAVWCGFQSD